MSHKIIDDAGNIPHCFAVGEMALVTTALPGYVRVLKIER